MYSYGIRGNASFLTGRSQYVMYDGMLSTTMSIKWGVPQGSNLGPQLCICTMNDIRNISDFLYTILYADDTCVLLNEKHYNDLVKFFNLELKKLSNRLRSNKLS